MSKPYIRKQMLQILDDVSSHRDTLSPVEKFASEKDLLTINQAVEIQRLNFMTADSLELRSFSPYFWYDLEILYRTGQFWFGSRSSKVGLNPDGKTFFNVIWTRIIEDSYEHMMRNQWQDKNIRILDRLLGSSNVMFKIKNEKKETNQ